MAKKKEKRLNKKKVNDNKTNGTRQRKGTAWDGFPFCKRSECHHIMKPFVIVQKYKETSDIVTHTKPIQDVQQNAMIRRKIKNNARTVRLICFVHGANTQKAALS